MLPLAESATTASDGPTLSGSDVLGAFETVVLCRLLRHRVGVRAAGDDCQDPAVGQTERRAALGGVDEREPAGCAGADVDQPAAAGDPLDDRLDCGCECGSRLAHGRRDTRILVVHELDELDRREQVDVGVQRLALLGDGLGASHARGV